MTQAYLIAHRGASAQAPENTVEAFKLAWEQGADGIEGDFRLTADGEIVCFHDEITSRVSDSKLKVSETILSKLKELDAGSWFDKKYANSKILTISEVFSLVPQVKQIFIEIKIGVEILPKLFVEIEKSNLENSQIKIISFNADVIQKFKMQRPDIQAFWIVDFNSDEFKKTEQEVLKILEEAKADGLSANHINVEETLIKNIIDEGYLVHLWAVDDLKEAKRFINLGVSSIITNKPGYLKSLFNQ